MMALDICNASQSFDIDGAQTKLDELKLENLKTIQEKTSRHAQPMLRNNSKLFRVGTHLRFVPVRSSCSSSVALNVNSLTGRYIQC
jgi:hypothetical protein